MRDGEQASASAEVLTRGVENDQSGGVAEEQAQYEGVHDREQWRRALSTSTLILMVWSMEAVDTVIWLQGHRTNHRNPDMFYRLCSE